MYIEMEHGIMSIEPYLNEQQIQNRISELAIEIDTFCNAQNVEELRLICVLRGAVHFFSDLTRKIQTECRYDFIGFVFLWCSYNINGQCKTDVSASIGFARQTCFGD